LLLRTFRKRLMAIGGMKRVVVSLVTQIMGLRRLDFLTAAVNCC